MDPEYHLKKRELKNLRYRNLPADSVLLYEDEKGPIAAKTYGGTSWSSITIQGIQGSEDKRNSKRVWCL